MEESPPVRSVVMNNMLLPKPSNSHMDSKLTGISMAPNMSCVTEMFKPKFPIFKYRQKKERSMTTFKTGSTPQEAVTAIVLSLDCQASCLPLVPVFMLS